MTRTAIIMRQEEWSGTARSARLWHSPLCAVGSALCHGRYFATAKPQDNPTGGSS